jgi:hypothetical protein
MKLAASGSSKTKENAEFEVDHDVFDSYVNSNSLLLNGMIGILQCMEFVHTKRG